MDSVKHLIRNSVMTARSLIQAPPTSDQLATRLSDASVPVTLDPCRSCPDPCDDNDTFPHEEWSTKFFDVDLSSDMLGSVKPYGRQVVISSGKMDWEREVTDAKGTFAHEISEANSRLSSKPPKLEKVPSSDDSFPKKEVVPGLFSSNSSTRLGILNGSHVTTCRDGTKQTILVFPDYKVVTEVVNTPKSAELLWKTTIDPHLGRGGDLSPEAQKPQTKSWTLPYSAVILLCSHKRRDNRCAIAAPVLKRSLCASLESLDWEVHDQVEDPDHFDEPPIEEIPGTAEEREAAILARLSAIGADTSHRKKALVLFVSHTGGHKFAGNLIIYTPQGAGVWYGRVSSHEIAAVTRTITEGKIYPSLLRGGVNLSRPQGKPLNDW